jgi:hypothetical protein
MPVMTLMLLASVLPFGLPLLNLSTRDGNDLCRKLLENARMAFRLSVSTLGTLQV